MGRTSPSVSSRLGPFPDLLRRNFGPSDSTARLAEAAELAPVGIVMVADGIVVDINRKGLGLGGYERKEEVTGRPFVERVAPAYREVLAEWNRLRVLGETVPDEYFLMAMRKNGTQFPCRTKVIQAGTTGKPVTIIYFSDTTEQPVPDDLLTRERRFEAAGRLSLSLANVGPDEDIKPIIAERFKDLVGAGAVSYASLDAASRELVVDYVTFSDPVLKMLGRLVGKSVEGLRVKVSADDLSAVIAERVRVTNDFTKIGFGLFPASAAGVIRQLFGVEVFVGCALVHGGELLATMALSMPVGRPAPDREVLLCVTSVAAAALRRWHLERESRARRPPAAH